MSHEVESLMYVSNEANGRFVPWHGLGTAVNSCPTSADAIKLAGLDWEVVQRPLYTSINNDVVGIPNQKVNIRNTDNNVLGIVTDRYKPVQNKAAFDFTDALIGEGCTYETAGSLYEGKKVFLLAKMPEQSILGEKFDPYICFTNTHDGTGAIRAVMTPVRVVCQNTLSLAINGATRAWSTRHLGDMQSKLAEARYTLKLANDYMEKFSVVADRLANTSITEDQTQAVIDGLFPVTSDMSERQVKNQTDKKDAFMVCMIAPDIVKYKGTAYQLIQAASDFATHRTPKRKTSTYQERTFNSVLDGNVVIDTTFLKMMKLVNKH
jgi:phage/plasmid-like protein (TIGR03299 family)